MSVSNRDITDSIEAVAPLSLQEEWDNSGYQLGNPDAECAGVLLCVDLTEEIVAEAVSKGCNLVVTHHPLMFRGVKQILGRNRVERVIAEAIRAGLTVYSSHTSVDNSAEGISVVMARVLGLKNIRVLVPSRAGNGSGLGAVGDLETPLTHLALVEKVKEAFDVPVARCSRPDEGKTVTRVALCGGAGTEFLPAAIAAGAQAYISSDSKLNQFIDWADDIFLTDIGHFEAEKCARRIFYDAICEKFRNFAVYYSEIEKNPIYYI